MANKNFNTQIRKKFDKGSEKPKDLLDRNPSKSLSPETKKRLRDAMERRRNLKRKEKTSKAKQPKRPIGKPPLKKEPLRKPSDKQQREMRRFKEEQKPMKTKFKDKVNKVKDKLNKVGNMKVKDAAKVVGKAALATTPIGLATNAAKSVNKNFKFQSPIVRKNKKFGGR